MRNLPARCASGILKAWQRQDAALLEEEFARAVSIGLQPLGNPFEEEAGEVLSAVAAEVRAMLRSGRISEAAQCFRLLSHLAWPWDESASAAA